MKYICKVKVNSISGSVLLIAMSMVAMSFQVDDWLLAREKKGIKVFTKKSRWGKLRDSKAEMILPNTNVEAIVKMIVDFDSYQLWLPRCGNAKVLARLSDNEFIAYMVFKSPWPVSDRDCVVRVRVERDADGGVTIHETSEPKYINKKSNVVRIEQMFSTWHFVPRGDGVAVSNEYSTNPGGDIPDWLTNTQSVENPYDIFVTIQNSIPSVNTGKGKIKGTP